MPKSPIKIEIISAVRNRREITLQCLRSLEKIEKTGLQVHTIIVDDGSTDGTVESVRSEFPNVEVIEGDGNLWCSGGVNVGVKSVLTRDPDYILVINDDTVFDSRFLRSMVETAESNPRSVVGGLLLLWDEPHRVFQVGARWDTWYGGWRHFNRQTVWTVPKSPFEVEIIVGNCVLFPAAAFREAGFFATKWLPQYGDAEFTPRLKRLGWKLLIDPSARVFNQPNELPQKMSEMTLKQLYGAIWKNYNGAHNLRNRFMCYWLGAPSKPKAVAAFTIYVGRMGLQGLGFQKNWTSGWAEKPLFEEYPAN